MNRRIGNWIAFASVALAGQVWGQPSSRPAGAPRVDVQEFLSSGKLEAAEKALSDALKADARDDQTRMGLGLVQTVRAFEHLMQGLHKYGLRGPGNDSILALGAAGVPPLPIAPNANPEEISYDKFRALLETWVKDLGAADQTFAKLSNADVKLNVQIGLVRMDFDGDGTAGEDEAFWKVYERLNRGADISLDDAKALIIGFDRADAEWLRGYCNLLMALSEFMLGHDQRDCFERTAHLMFPRVQTPHAFLKQSRPGRGEMFEFESIIDLIALVHTVHWPVQDAARLKSSLEHLQTMSACSRKMWKLILAETDDDHEWIPSPKQTGIIPDMKFTDEMVRGWTDFLDELDAILAGKKLLPFWRGTDSELGVNLNKVLTSPQMFDLVLWVQGTGATPYLEHGTVTRSETWERLDRIFGGQFVGIAFWLN